MLVATKVKLSMERLARLLKETYGGGILKVAGDRQFEEMGGVIDQSIASQHSVRVSR